MNRPSEEAQTAERAKPPSPRTLEKDVPELKDYLRAGMKVLDVGCGPGTITLDVAVAVSPGEVVGIDPSENRLQMARDLAAESSSDAHLSFKSGDCHHLDFSNDAFDLVYSHTVTHFFLDPVRALREQKRVVKPGGWVIASGVRDPGILTRYPPCPHWDEAWRALKLYNDGVREKFRTSGDDPADFLTREMKSSPTYMIHFDMQSGRKCISWFNQAGLGNLKSGIKGSYVQFPGADTMKPSAMDMLMTGESDSNSGSQEMINLSYKRMIAEGLIDQETLDRAQEEAEAWYNDPQAFHYWVLVFVAGQA